MSNIVLRELTGNIAIYPLIRTKEELFPQQYQMRTKK